MAEKQTAELWKKVPLGDYDKAGNWVEVKVGDLMLRLRKGGVGGTNWSIDKEKNQGYGECESFECPVGEEAKRGVKPSGYEGEPLPYQQNARDIVETTYQHEPAPAAPKIGTPAVPGPGWKVRAVAWDEASSTLYNVAFWPPQ